MTENERFNNRRGRNFPAAGEKIPGTARVTRAQLSVKIQYAGMAELADAYDSGNAISV